MLEEAWVLNCEFCDFEGEFFYSLLLIIVQLDVGAVVAVELPCGRSHAKASVVHSTDACEFTHATIFALIPLLTELFRICGNWKKLNVGVYVHVLPSYVLWQQRRVNLFGFVGWGKIGPG
jgi:ABC-type arginine/histidine transport system permease subunit